SIGALLPGTRAGDAKLRQAPKRDNERFYGSSNRAKLAQLVQLQRVTLGKPHPEASRMTQNQTLNGALDTRLNHLYWSTDRTVEQILNELSLARSALYASIEPVPAGMACSSCGEVVVFTNRTNRASGSG